MIYTPLTIKAINLAYQAHEGQFDKGGLPYIFHPYHLAEQMKDEYSVCAAVLHDVVEDTDVGIDVIAREFPTEVAQAVQLLTHDPETPYLEYIERLKDDPIACQVKLADLTHNMDDTRSMDSETESAEKKEKRREKYTRAKEILLNK
ncbi:MAG: HD domain-containing protein [Lachnospiraceae bacterium]|nr:HD domain-containing protein [Lachnospiraceae bacterium]